MDALKTTKKVTILFYFLKKTNTKKPVEKKLESTTTTTTTAPKTNSKKKSFKFGVPKEEPIPHMPAEVVEKKDDASNRKISKSKTPDKKSDDEEEFKIQLINRPDEKTKSLAKQPSQESENESKSDLKSETSHLDALKSDNEDESRAFSEKDFDDLKQEDIDKIQMQVRNEIIFLIVLV